MFDKEDWEVFHFLLAEQEEVGKRSAEAEAQIFRDRLDHITGSMIHRKLDVNVPELDREHLRAVLVYGFVAPTQQRMFAGSREIAPETIRQFVENKLAMSFDSDQFDQVLRWLIRNKVTMGHKGLSLSTQTGKCTSAGREVLQRTIEFAREVRAKK